MAENSKKTMLLNELLSHLPFSIFFTGAGMAVAGLLLYVAIVSAPAIEEPHAEHEKEAAEAPVGHHEEAGESCPGPPRVRSRGHGFSVAAPCASAIWSLTFSRRSRSSFSRRSNSSSVILPVSSCM